MNKKTNTLLFILGGTLFNILITILSFIIFLALSSAFIFPRLPADSSTWGWVMAFNFIASIVVSFLVYRLAIKIIAKKVDLNKYFDPIFNPRRPPKDK
ncbi:MAG: leader peptide processing enzyme [Treponema sp.]|nr:leader peptide processing enzyme [Treponema sp.]